MIPLLLKDDVISVFLISVKNHKAQFDSSWPSSAGSGISLQTVCPELSNVPSYFTLLMQLGARESMVFAGQLKKHSALAVFGLNTFCPSIGTSSAEHLVYQRLRAILNARQGIEGIPFDKASIKVVTNLVPLHWKAGGKDTRACLRHLRMYICRSLCVYMRGTLCMGFVIMPWLTTLLLFVHAYSWSSWSNRECIINEHIVNSPT
jgi:hypothetical protein